MDAALILIILECMKRQAADPVKSRQAIVKEVMNEISQWQAKLVKRIEMGADPAGADPT